LNAAAAAGCRPGFKMHAKWPDLAKSRKNRGVDAAYFLGAGVCAQ
jgi:hypothetical protein